MGQDQKLLKAAKKTVAALWDQRPTECIELQNAIDRYELVTKAGVDEPIRIQYLDMVLHKTARVVDYG